MTTGAQRRAVVLGGAGFIGSHLCDALINEGFAVVCVDNFCTGRFANISHLTDEPRFSLVVRDVTDSLRDLGPADLVFHLASAASPPAYARLPMETLRAGSVGTEQALVLAQTCRARFVLASTSEVYGDPAVHPQVESYFGHVNPVGPRSVYDEAKRYAEALTAAYRREFGTDTAIARIFNTYGPRMRPDDGRMIPAFVRQALAGEPLTVTGNGEQTRSICYVDDTVAGLLALAFSAEPGPINLGNPVERTVTEIAHLVRELVGSTSPIRHVDPVLDDPQRRCPDISAAIRRLGWRPAVDLSDGLKLTIAALAGELDDRAAAGEANHL